MRWSQLFVPTLRETPAEAEVVSHRLLLRAGYVRQLAAGIYSYLPLAKRSLLRIEQIVREEMDSIGAQEFHLPELHPAELWQQSGRWEAMGSDMFRLQDRWGRDLCLGMTEEEVMTLIACGELRSYKQLPQLWYQIQVKFRDEPRPKSGLMRTRLFTMKDSYSFDIDEDGLETSYRKHHDAYCRILERCGLSYLVVEAHSGEMGGSKSQEFVVPSEAGEDIVVICEGCGYEANIETAESLSESSSRKESEQTVAQEVFATPGKRTIDEVAEFDGLPVASHIKTLVMVADGKPMLVLLQGNDQLSDAKLSSVVGADLRPARGEEISEWLGASAGSVGPVGVETMEILADSKLEGRRNMIVGANRDDHHLRHVAPGEDFEARFVDLRQVEEGDSCVRCSQPLRHQRCIEVGHIFKLNRKYSNSMGLRVLDSNGKGVAPIMGSYGIGLERILTAAIEQNHDEFGIVLPAPIAPFQVVVTPVNMKNDNQRQAAENTYRSCCELGLDALLDDRQERPGVKFNDADLVGIPYRITVGKKVEGGTVELTERSTHQSTDVKLEGASERVKQSLKKGSLDVSA